MVNKNGWLRIVEATLGVILILGSILIYYQRNQVEIGENFGENLPFLMDEIAKNNSLRIEIINVDPSISDKVKEVENNIYSFLYRKIERNDLNYSVSICNAENACELTTTILNSDGNLYSHERIISTYINSSVFNPKITPKKIKIYI